MIIIVDGYNMLRTWYPQATIDERTRYLFVQKIADYGVKRRHKMVVVFDGGIYEWPYKEKMAGVSVIYSARESADEIIMQYLDDHKNKDILLVTSDHELNLFASHHNIVSVGSEEFIYLVKEALQEEAVSHQEESIVFDESATDIAIIMEQATTKMEYKESDKLQKHERLTVDRVSKKDKALLKKLKKL